MTRTTDGVRLDAVPDGPDRRAPTEVLVAILGTGFGGLGMAIRLMQAGIDDILLLERADSVGGTWRDNTYPGAACDIPSHLYSFSFELNPYWSHVYACQPEIRAYLEHCADHYGLRRHIRFGAEVIEARFDEPTARWHVRTRDGQVVIARYLVHAVGALRDPRLPALPGVGDFDGPALHSARWDHDVELTGKRIGVIGTGASAIQIVPELAKVASRMKVYQRTPPWVAKRSDRAYSEREKQRFAEHPAVMRLHRWWIYSSFESRYPAVFGQRSIIGAAVEWKMRREIRTELPDPAMVAAATPDYQLGCKRILLSDDWYPTLAQPHVDVETTPIARIASHGITLADGRDDPLDVLIYCTGFNLDRPLGTVEVTGRGGVSLNQWWGERPRAYLGITVPHCPNAFILQGPNTGLGHNSVIVMLEAQIGYAQQAIEYMQQHPELASLEIDEAVTERFVQQLDDDHGNQVWQSGCDSWYLGPGGVNTTLWPGSTVGYVAQTRRFDPSVYRRRGWAAQASANLPSAVHRHTDEPGCTES